MYEHFIFVNIFFGFSLAGCGLEGGIVGKIFHMTSFQSFIIFSTHVGWMFMNSTHNSWENMMLRPRVKLLWNDGQGGKEPPPPLPKIGIDRKTMIMSLSKLTTNLPSCNISYISITFPYKSFSHIIFGNAVLWKLFLLSIPRVAVVVALSKNWIPCAYECTLTWLFVSVPTYHR